MKKKIVGGSLFLLLGVFYFVINKKWGISIPCFFHELTGFYCPGCGITRMFFSMFEFQFYEAFRYNPLVFILIIGYIVYKIINLKYTIIVPKYGIYIILIVTILFGILRNVPGFEFLGPI